jgi:integrase/recombinase XerD
VNNTALLGTWIRRFLLEHLVAERNLALNTQRSYRDTLVLLIPFVAKEAGKAVDHLSVVDLSAELIRLFLADLETSRRCAIVTRNQRLAAIHALARFVGEHSPEHIAGCTQLRTIPFKKPNARAVIAYLDKSEMDALLAAPDVQTAQGRRDQALLLFLCNSGARASEAAQLLIAETLSEHFVRDHPGQRRQEASVPAVVSDHSRACRVNRWTFPHRSRLFESLWLSPNALRHPHPNLALRR